MKANISHEISIHYYTLAANQNDPRAQYNLGIIYYSGQYINKSIYYFTLDANQNHLGAQFNLGSIYYSDQYIARDINKSWINLLDKSSSAGNIPANFVIGYLYHEGKFIDRNMNKSIKHYKYASSLNDFYSKNNLGVIYKNGIDEIRKNR